MIGQLRAAYTDYRWAKVVVCIGLCICGLLLYGLFGGFPPWAWRFLIQVLPQLPHLWEMQGSAILLPFIGLLLLSTALFLLWGLLVGTFFQVMLHWWRDWRQQQHLALELQEAEYLAEQQLAATASFEQGQPQGTLALCTYSNRPPMTRCALNRSPLCQLTQYLVNP